MMNRTCCQCDLEASMRIMNIDVNGNMREAYLCSKHANYFVNLSRCAYDLIENLPSKPVGIVFSKHICPKCGCSKEWMEQNARVGCCECYRLLDNILVDGFKSNSVHFGKIPAKKQVRESYRPRIQFLRKRLQAYLRIENFEQVQIYQHKLDTIFESLKNASIDF